MFGEKLNQLRVKKGLKIKEVAEAIGVDPSTYGKYENGQRHPSYQILVELSNFFDVSTDYLTGKTESKRPITSDHLDDSYTKIKETFGDDAEVMFHDISKFDQEDFEKLQLLVNMVKNQKK